MRKRNRRRFLFAPKFHSAMKHAIGPRREMGVRTVFNLLGPLTNPAGAPNQVIGVFSAHWVEPLAEVLQKLGSEHVLVVHAEDGMDEISIGAPTRVAELKDGRVRVFTIQPEQFGFARGDVKKLGVTSPAESLAIIRGVFDNQPGPAHDIVALNAGAAIYAAGLAPNLDAGVKKAAEVIASGAARAKFDALTALSKKTRRRMNRPPDILQKSLRASVRKSSSAAHVCRWRTAPARAGRIAHAWFRQRHSRAHRPGQARGDRRNQEGEPEQGPVARRFQSRRNRPKLRAPRRHLPVGAHRPRFFQGADEHLQEGRAACSLPALRKDFTIDSIRSMRRAHWEPTASCSSLQRWTIT